MRKLVTVIVPGEVCGGCDVSLVNLHEDFLELAEVLDVVFWPIAIDVKEEDLEELDSIDVAIFQGSLRTNKQRELVEYIAKKAKIRIAYGSCACFGGIPSLADLYRVGEILDYAYRKTPSSHSDNPIPALSGGARELPKLLNFNFRVDEFVDVDIYIPGCPPSGDLIRQALKVLKEYAEKGIAPKKQTILGSLKSLCDECPRKKPEVVEISEFRRLSSGRPDPEKCFLSQGIVCLGPITRAGCGAPCINANVPCRGCMGPLFSVYDPGAKFASTIASIIKIRDEEKMSDDELVNVVRSIADPVGTFYRFTMGLNKLVRVKRSR